MADRDDDTRSNRGFAAMDRETRERIARKGGEESHKNDDTRSSSSSRGSPSGRSESSGGRGGSRGGRAGEGEGAHYDPKAGQCRDDSGQFVECPEGEEGTRQDPNKERFASKGGEHSHGGHGRSSGSRSRND